MRIEFFVPRRTLLKQAFKMRGKALLGFVRREAGALVHDVVPVLRPDAVFGAGTGLPVQHRLVEVQVEVPTELPKDAFRIEQEFPRIEDRRALSQLAQAEEQVPLLREARVSVSIPTRWCAMCFRKSRLSGFTFCRSSRSRMTALPSQFIAAITSSRPG